MAVKTFVDTLLPRHDWGLIWLAVIGLVAIYATAAGLNVVVTYWGHVLGIEIETEMRRQAFDHLQTLSFRFYDGQKTGHLVARVTKDLEEIGEVAHHGPEDLFIALMTLTGAFILMLFVHWPLALVTAAVVPIGVGVGTRYGAAMERNWRGAVRPRRRLQRAARGEHRRHPRGEGLRQRGPRARAVRARQSRLPRRQARGLQDHGRRDHRELPRHAPRADRGDLLAGTFFVVGGGLTIGGFVGFLLLLGVFYRPLDKIAAVIESYPKGVAGFRRFQRAARHQARRCRDARRRGGRSFRRSDPLRTRGLRLRRGTTGDPKLRPDDPPGRDGGLRRAVRRRQEPRSARCCRASTTSRPVASPSMASTCAP